MVKTSPAKHNANDNHGAGVAAAAAADSSNKKAARRDTKRSRSSSPFSSAHLCLVIRKKSEVILFAILFVRFIEPFWIQEVLSLPAW